MITVGAAKSDVAARSTEGCKGLRVPVTGRTEKLALVAECAGCSKLATHQPAEWIGWEPAVGEHGGEGIPDAEKITVPEAIAMRSAIWKLHNMLFGVASGTLYNLGDGANNVSQQLSYEIVSASGNTLTVRGQNPKRVTFGNSQINPDWPGIDPETGEPVPRLISYETAGALPVGGMVVFDYPSALREKLTPYVLRVVPPASDDAEVEFDLELSHHVNYADTPEDEKFPPGDGVYRCTIFFYWTAPEPHPNYQVEQRTQFTRRTVVYTAAAITGAGGAVGLLRSDSEPGRVVMPSMAALWHEAPVVLTVARTGSQELVVAGDDIVTTADTGTGWETALDLSGFEGPDLIEVSVRYWVESVTGDAQPRRPFVASCINSQVDYSGSYIHDSGTGRFCANVECSEFANFRGECWKPGASGFTLTGGNRAVHTVADASWWARCWEDVTLVLEQGIPGVSSHRNFSFRRVGGPSLGEMIGRFHARVFSGYFASREPWFSPAMGQRVLNDDGVYVLAPGLYIQSDEGNNVSDAASRTKAGGVLRSVVPGWASRADDSGATPAGDVSDFPSGHMGGVHLYEWARSSGQAVRCRLGSAVEQRFVTGHGLDVPEDTGITAGVRSWV